MASYLARRLLGLGAVWLVLSVVSFSLVHLAGGSPASVILGVQATPEAIAQLNPMPFKVLERSPASELEAIFIVQLLEIGVYPWGAH